MTKKKAVIIIVSFVCISSITLNIYQYYKTKDVISDASSRLKFSTSMITIFNYHFRPIVSTNNALKFKDTHTLDSTYLNAIDLTISNIREINEDLIEISGGLNPETAVLANPDKFWYINSYFYDDNPKRAYAIDYFNSTMTNYFSICDSLNLKSSLSLSFDLSESVYGPKIFYGLSVGETKIILDNIQQALMLDEVKYRAENLK